MEVAYKPSSAIASVIINAKILTEQGSKVTFHIMIYR